MAIKYTFNMTDDAIAAGAASVKKRAGSIRKHVHFLNVSILFQWGKTGDAGAMAAKASVMLNSVDGSHKQKVVDWFGMFAGLQLNEEKDGFIYTNTTIDAETFQAAKAETMYDVSPDKEVQVYDLRAKIINLIKSAENKRTKGLGEKDNVSVEDIAALKAIVS